MECAHCGKNIGVLRKLKHAKFCSAAHQKAYLKKQEALALDFLLQNRPRSRSQVRPVGPAQAATPAVRAQPLPPAAKFVPEHAAPVHLVASVESSAQSRSWQAQPVLPAPTGPGSSAVRVSGFAGFSGAAGLCPARAPSTGRGEFPFVSGRPRIRGASMAPLWITPAARAPAERPQAGFLPLRPRWASREPGEVRAATVIRSTIAPCMGDAALTPRSPSLGMAFAARFPVEMSQRLAVPLGSAGTPWQSAWKPIFEWRAPVTLRKSGISFSQEMALPAPRSKPAPPAAVRSAARRSMMMANPELRVAANLGGRRCSLAYAEPAAIAAWQDAPAIMPTASATMPLGWRYQVLLGPYRRVIAVRPNFEKPALEVPSHEDPIRLPEAVVRVRGAVRLAQVKQAMPGWSWRLAVVALLAVAVYVGAGRWRYSAAATGAQNEMWACIGRRAAFKIQDDFRSGLSQWSGAPDWANSWSYDGTGFARPGRLALLSSSLPLNDYRLNFTAQIERTAVAWVFRAADRNNYYATKLVESKRGAALVFFIVRYAVIDGRERFKAELPLALNPSAKTLLHVRQEVRGAQFTTYLDGSIIDTWSDASLARGGVGFFADTDEAAYVRSIEVTQNDDALGRLCSYLASAHGR